MLNWENADRENVLEITGNSRNISKLMIYKCGLNGFPRFRRYCKNWNEDTKSRTSNLLLTVTYRNVNLASHWTEPCGLLIIYIYKVFMLITQLNYGVFVWVLYIYSIMVYIEISFHTKKRKISRVQELFRQPLYKFKWQWRIWNVIIDSPVFHQHDIYKGVQTTLSASFLYDTILRDWGLVKLY